MMTIEIVGTADFNASKFIFESIRKEIQDVFGADMKVEFKISDELAIDSSGKLKKIISRLNVASM